MDYYEDKQEAARLSYSRSRLLGARGVFVALGVVCLGFGALIQFVLVPTSGPAAGSDEMSPLGLAFLGGGALALIIASSLTWKAEQHADAIADIVEKWNGRIDPDKL